MITKLRKRIESEKGFTLIEMLIVIIILGILIAIAVPAYLKFRDNANKSAAQSNIRAAIPAMEDYNATNSGYLGMTEEILRDSYDKALKLAPAFDVVQASATGYCVTAKSGPHIAWKTSVSDVTLHSDSPKCTAAA